MFVTYCVSITKIQKNIGDYQTFKQLFLSRIQVMTHGAIDPTSFIYTSKPRKYTRYTLSSKMEDFELFNNMLNEIIINSSIK